MKKLKSKLASRRGATLLFAMLVFLLCVLAGTAALTAAATNSGRYTHMANDQQKYLAVSSAVELVKNELTRFEYKVDLEVKEKVEYSNWPIEIKSRTTTVTPVSGKFVLHDSTAPDPGAPDPGATSPSFLFESLFSEYLSGACEYALTGASSPGDLTGEIKINLEGMPEVVVEVIMNSYDITMNFYIEDASDQIYYSTMTLAGNSVVTSDRPTEVADGDPDGGNYTITSTRTDHFTVSWETNSVTISAMKPPAEGGGTP